MAELLIEHETPGLAESGEAGDETIRDIAGHVSKRILKHYSHIGMEAKRWAVEFLVPKKSVEREPRSEDRQLMQVAQL